MGSPFWSRIFQKTLLFLSPSWSHPFCNGQTRKEGEYGWKSQQNFPNWSQSPSIKVNHSIWPRTYSLETLGFRFHHCKKDYLMLAKWLSKDEKDNMPEYATHFIGVGGTFNFNPSELLINILCRGCHQGRHPRDSCCKGKSLCDQRLLEDSGRSCWFQWVSSPGGETGSFWGNWRWNRVCLSHDLQGDHGLSLRTSWHLFCVPDETFEFWASEVRAGNKGRRMDENSYS